MEAMIYIIRFEENLGLGDIDFYLKEIESPIRLEVGDKIALSFASFDRSFEDDKDYIGRMVELLLEKSIYPSKYRASFEISDIMYSHEFYDDDDDGINIHGVITLKGK